MSCALKIVDLLLVCIYILYIYYAAYTIFQGPIKFFLWRNKVAPRGLALSKLMRGWMGLYIRVRECALKHQFA